MGWMKDQKMVAEKDAVKVAMRENLRADAKG
jgi:hypothetical protein